MANFTLITTLVQRREFIFFDEEIHASLKEGIHACGAIGVKFRHNDLNDLENRLKKIQEKSTKKIWLVIETIYSMSGSAINLPAYADLATRYDLQLIIDEAHATGLAHQGRGMGWQLKNRAEVLSIHTCGKAWGGSGAIVCGPKILINYLINRARPFIYTTGVAPLFAFHLKTAVEYIKENPEICMEHKKMTETANQLLEKKLAITLPRTHIIPIIVFENKRALELSKQLQEKGFDIRAIRPPTVKQGTARLRISITRNVTLQDIFELVDQLKSILRETDLRNPH